MSQFFLVLPYLTRVRLDTPANPVMGQSCSLQSSCNHLSNVTDVHDPSSTSPSRAVIERAQDENVAPDHISSTQSVNIHAVLHDWAIRDEIRLRAQQQLVADRLERSRHQHIMPPYNHAMRGEMKQLHLSQDLSSFTLSAATPRSGSNMSRTGR
ncbi:Hypothetical protein, putative, partial [Bodo saltans]